MDDISVAIDTGHAALAQQRMRHPSVFGCRRDRVRIVAAAARYAILGTHLCHDLRGQLGPASLPELGVAVVVRPFSDDVVNTGGDVRVSLDKPVGLRNMAIAATRPDSPTVGEMRRLLEMGIGDYELHRMAGGAERDGRCVVIE